MPPIDSINPWLCLVLDCSQIRRMSRAQKSGRFCPPRDEPPLEFDKRDKSSSLFAIAPHRPHSRGDNPPQDVADRWWRRRSVLASSAGSTVGVSTVLPVSDGLSFWRLAAIVWPSTDDTSVVMVLPTNCRPRPAITSAGLLCIQKLDMRRTPAESGRRDTNGSSGVEMGFEIAPITCSDTSSLSLR